MKTRQEIINEAKRISREIELNINTVDYWNKNVRKPHEKEIDPDPHGEYARIKKWCNGLLANEIRISEPKPNQ